MIYVLGSLNADLTVRTRVPKKGETVLADGFSVFCGGKGANQAVAAAKLGGAVSMVGHVGADVYGTMLMDYLRAYRVDVSNVTAKGCTSGLAMIWVSRGDNRIVVAPGANMRFETDEIDVALSAAGAGDILVAQLEIPVGIVTYAFTLAKKLGMTTILNPAPAQKLPDALLCRTDIIMPNENETEQLTGIQPKDTVHAVLAVKKFYEAGVGAVVITLGARGSIVAVGQTVTEIPARRVKAVDTTGAGDTYVGAVAQQLAQGVDLAKACEFATAASSITVQRQGAGDSIPTLEEVRSIL